MATPCFPAEYRGDIFAAFHGSWNRKKRIGYKIVRVPFAKAGGKPRGEVVDFVTGFVADNDRSGAGRPESRSRKTARVLFSDDANNTMWRVSYAER